VVATEREKFLVPVAAVGEAAQLDMPPAVDMGAGPTKLGTRSTLLVRGGDGRRVAQVGAQGGFHSWV